jgi:hypothetical protein
MQIFLRYEIYGVFRILEKLHVPHVFAVVCVGPLEGQSGAPTSGQMGVHVIVGVIGRATVPQLQSRLSG